MPREEPGLDVVRHAFHDSALLWTSGRKLLIAPVLSRIPTRTELLDRWARDIPQVVEGVRY